MKVGQLNGGTGSAQQYNSASISVVRGDTVRWEWFNGTHDIQSANAPGLSPGPRAGFNSLGQVYQYTFNTAGTYTYYCDEHAGPGDADLANINQSLADGKMVGKVVVTAPVADTLAPAVSGVAAAPNPTAGSGAVTLTATVTDTAPAGATARVAGAEWSRGASAVAAGTGAAMAASDAAFNSATEGVTANVPISEAAGTSVTLWVRGRDAAGLWSAAVPTLVSVTVPPAGAVQATVTLSGGSLSNVAQSIAFPGVSATGLNQTVAGSTTPAWRAKDARGTAAGWNVTVISSNFSGSGGSILVDNFKVQLTAVTTVAGNTAPAASPASYTALSLATPLKLLSAALNTGMGTYDYTPQFQLTVPGSAVVGSYTANVTVSVNSGP